jgi:hypothetical protein
MLVLRGLLAADQPIRWSALAPFVILLLGFSFFSFIVGSSGSPDPLTAHNYFKLILGCAAVFRGAQCHPQLQRGALADADPDLAGTAAALLGHRPALRPRPAGPPRPDQPGADRLPRQRAGFALRRGRPGRLRASDWHVGRPQRALAA